MKAELKFAMTVGVAIPLGFFLAAWNVGGGPFSPGATAWAQIVGVVLAIIGTYWASTLPVRAEARRQAQRRTEWIEAILWCAHDCVRLLDKAEEYLASEYKDDEADFDPDNFKLVHAALSELPLRDIPSGKMVRQILVLRRMSHYYPVAMKRAVEARTRRADQHPLVEVALGRYSAAIRKAYKAAEEEGERLIDAEHNFLN